MEAFIYQKKATSVFSEIEKPNNTFKIILK
jgi:hypothetical protein